MSANQTSVIEIPVIVCTEHRGVFFGYANEDDICKDVIKVKRGRMAISFGTTRGVVQLAETGPTERSKISDKADMVIRKVTAVFLCSEAATQVWEATK